MGAVFGLIEQRIFSMQDRLFQSALAEVVVERGAGDAQEQVSLLKWCFMYEMALPRPELGSTFRSAILLGSGVGGQVFIFDHGRVLRREPPGSGLYI
jgi:hypothetical protein